MSPQYGIDNPSLSNGYWFYFHDEGTPITAFGSALSGRERIFIGEELISSQRSWNFNTCHKFTHNGSDYEIEFRTTNWLKGELVCSLKKNGVLLDTATKAYATTPDNAFSWRKFLLSVLYGGIFGFCVAWGFFAAKNYFDG